MHKQRPAEQARRSDRRKHGMFGAVWSQVEMRKTLAAAGEQLASHEFANGSPDHRGPSTRSTSRFRKEPPWPH
jgi:hypothetical protein